MNVQIQTTMSLCGCPLWTNVIHPFLENDIFKYLIFNSPQFKRNVKATQKNRLFEIAFKVVAG